VEDERDEAPRKSRLSTEDKPAPQSPEEEELNAKLEELAELEDELARTELELLDLKLRLAQFEKRYLSQVARRIAVLEELQKRIDVASAILPATKHRRTLTMRLTSKMATTPTEENK